MQEKEEQNLNESNELKNGYARLSENTRKAVVLISILNLFVYGQTLFFGFSLFDDEYLILKNMDLLAYISNVSRIFQMPYFDFFYRPFMMLSFLVDTQIGGDSPVIFHLTNVLLHILTSCLVFLLLRKIQPLRAFALGGGLLFSVLPINSQAVAWIPGRNDSLLAFFILASLYTLLLYREQPKIKYLVFHLLLFFCGLLTKEIALVFPLAAWMVLYFNVRNKHQSQPLTPIIIGWGVSLLLWYVIRTGIVVGTNNQDMFLSFGAIVGNIRVILEVLGKSILPFGLSALALFNPLSTLIGVITLIAFLLTVFPKKDLINRNVFIFGISWFILFLLPTLVMKIFDSTHRFDYVENRAYLSMFGLIVVIAELFRVWKKTIDNRTIIVFTCLVLIYGFIAIFHSMNFKSPVRVWTHITETSPFSADGFFTLGTIYEDSTDLKQSARCYARACELNSENISYHNNLGSVYAKMGLFPQATQEFYKSISLDSLNPYPYHNLGSIFYFNRDFAEAERYWKRAIDLQPDISDPYIKIIRLYIMERRESDALRYAQALKEKGIDIVPQVVQALRQMASDTTGN